MARDRGAHRSALATPLACRAFLIYFSPHETTWAAAVAALMLPIASANAATTSPTKPVQAKGSMQLTLPDAYWVKKQAVIVPSRTLHVHGVVVPYVKGQKVTVKAFLQNKLVKTVHLWIYPSKSGRYGWFNESLSMQHPGNVLVQVTHAKNAAQRGFGALRRYAVLNPSAGFGSTGPFVQLIQERLRALHFYLIESASTTVTRGGRSTLTTACSAGAPRRPSTRRRSSTCSTAGVSSTFASPTKASTPRATSQSRCSR